MLCLKSSTRLGLILAATAWAPTCVLAHTEFQKGFIDLYTKGPDADRDFRKLARKAKCYLCHQGKEDRTNYNRYGEVMLDYLTEDDKKDKPKIAAALKTVGDLPSDGPDSPTFAELIARGDLPGGTLEASKKEPPKADPE